MFGKLLEPEITSLIRERDFAGIRQIFCDWPAADLAELIADLPEEDQVVLFRILPHNLAGPTFEYLSRHDQKRLLEAMGVGVNVDEDDYWTREAEPDGNGGER